MTVSSYLKIECWLNNNLYIGEVETISQKRYSIKDDGLFGRSGFIAIPRWLRQCDAPSFMTYSSWSNPFYDNILMFIPKDSMSMFSTFPRSCAFLKRLIDMRTHYGPSFINHSVDCFDLLFIIMNENQFVCTQQVNALQFKSWIQIVAYHLTDVDRRNSEVANSQE